MISETDLTDEALPFNKVQEWRVPALKLYCRKRGLKVSGAKEELVARVFTAMEMKIPIQPTAEERIATTVSEKARLLDLGNGASLPDPASLTKDWLGEKDGITSWPPIFLCDITVYLMADHPGKDVNLHARVLNEYKEGKAFRLYDAGWLKEIYWHPVSNESKLCFLKASCTHTMSINNVQHSAWIAADKKSGKIASAYCSCVAGMSSSCIHVTALLFRVEAANRNGMTNPACTSKECVWTVPAGKTVVQPKKICDMVWTAAKLNKEPKRPTVDSRRALFEPADKKVITDQTEWRSKLYRDIKDAVPDSCFVVMQDAEHTEEIYRPLSVPSDILTAENIEHIEQATMGQAENPMWHEQRKGRITASNFYRVKTKVDSLKKGERNDLSAENLVSSLNGKSAPPNIPALKYGREMEPTAKAAFLDIYQQSHINASHRECGLFIHDTKQFLGASPDLLLECSCCGKGVLEVKCPISVSNDIPTTSNLNYLVNSNGKDTLKKKHAYYAQVQGQMAIAKRKWCQFLVYTPKGMHLECIHLDMDYWQSLQDSLEWFYENYLKPATNEQ